jgi:3-dehydroquinate synthase
MTDPSNADILKMDALQTDERIGVVLSGAGSRRYDIVVQANLLARLGEECRRVLPDDARILLLTDAHVSGLYLEPLLASLQTAGFRVETCVIPAGEESKSLEQAQQVFERALQMHLSRKDAIVGLGGGVIGDLAGFCASTYHRGTNVIHVPTTLVAQVDSAIGGKTAVNFGSVKNIIGTFHQPLLVLADPNLLNTLPVRELAAGMAEVIKYGLIETSCYGGTGFFDWLGTLSSEARLKAAFPEMIRRCAAIKAAVVMQDELETKGVRFFLNLGHTFGHAYESLSHYELLHGEAVAIGLAQAVRLACLLERFPVAAEQQLHTLLRQFALQESLQQAKNYSADALLACMKKDKKNRNNQIRLILPEKTPGVVIVRDDIPDAMILQVLSSAL